MSADTQRATRLRAVEGLTNVDAADRLGVDESTVRRWRRAVGRRAHAALRGEVESVPGDRVHVPEEDGWSDGRAQRPARRRVGFTG